MMSQLKEKEVDTTIRDKNTDTETQEEPKISSSAHTPHFDPHHINYYSNDGKNLYSVKSVLYSVAIFFFNVLLTTFFRKIDIKGSSHLIELQKKCALANESSGNESSGKRKEAIMIMCAPHANQFIDGGFVMSQIYNVTSTTTIDTKTKIIKPGSRFKKLLTPIHTCFVIAASSFDRLFVSQFSTMTGGIPVPRAQDYLKKIDSDKFGILINDCDDEKSGEGEGEQYSVTVVGVSDDITDKDIKELFERENFTVKGLIGIKGSNAAIKSIDLNRNKISLVKDILKSKILDPSIINASKEHKPIPFKYAPKMDQSKVFEKVFNHLNTNGTVGIFPEGGSHDRPQLLPIKPGVAIMALGATCGGGGGGIDGQGNNLTVNIVPCGLNYFNRDKFRSRAVLEIGEPIPITYEEWGCKYEKDPRKTVAELMPILEKSLYSVTINTPDYDTLKMIQVARRLLYKNNTSKLSYNVEINRRLIEGYNKFGSSDERLIELKSQLLQYDQELNDSGLKDHQIEKLQNLSAIKSFLLLVGRFLKLVFMLTWALPGSILFSPVFITAHYISIKKAKEGLNNSVVKLKGNDLLATWKLVVGLAMAPVLYITYSILLMSYYPPVFISSWKSIQFVFCYGFFVLITYISLKTGEIGMDIFKSLPPLFVSLIYPNWKLHYLQKFRFNLQKNLKIVCDDLGPKIWDNYKEMTDEFEIKLENERERSRSRSNSRSASRSASRSSSVASSRSRSDSIGSSILSTSSRRSSFSSNYRNVNNVYDSDSEDDHSSAPGNQQTTTDHNGNQDDFEIIDNSQNRDTDSTGVNTNANTGSTNNNSNTDSNVSNKITERIRKSRKA